MAGRSTRVALLALLAVVAVGAGAGLAAITGKLVIARSERLAAARCHEPGLSPEPEPNSRPNGRPFVFAWPDRLPEQHAIIEPGRSRAGTDQRGDLRGRQDGRADGLAVRRIGQGPLRTRLRRLPGGRLWSRST